MLRSCANLTASKGIIRECRHFISSTASTSNCYRSSIGGSQRRVYLGRFPTKVVNSDGSSYTIMYHEPRQIITLPHDINQMSDAQRLEVLAGRRPMHIRSKDEEVEITDEEEASLDYTFLWQKNNNTTPTSAEKTPSKPPKKR